ncbi:hypothetical protein BSKO_09294 [Bryopsis sp. KO-2023]|nr:hypothetical protein BSKO_09294 [Bryopsis sp. KO-2023]
MSDFKSMFRKAQVSRGVGSSKVQLKKLKAQKRAVRFVTPSPDEPKTSPESLDASVEHIEIQEEDAVKVDKKRPREEGPSDAELMPPPPPRRPSALDQPQQASNSELPPPAPSDGLNSASVEDFPTALPDNFFQQAPDAEDPLQASNVTATRSNPGTVPEGFFEDKEADGLARGIKPRTKKDKEAEYLDFQREMEASMQDLAEREAVDAEDGARSREETEAFEQELRFRLVSSLREKHEGRKTGEGVKGNVDGEKPKKKKRSRMDLPESDSDVDSSDSDDGDSLTDWRAKAV